MFIEIENTCDDEMVTLLTNKLDESINAIDEAEQEKVIHHHSHQLPAEQATPRCRPQNDCVNVIRTGEESRPLSTCTNVELDGTIDDKEAKKANMELQRKQRRQRRMGKN